MVDVLDGVDFLGGKGIKRANRTEQMLECVCSIPAVQRSALASGWDCRKSSRFKSKRQVVIEFVRCQIYIFLGNAVKVDRAKHTQPFIVRVHFQRLHRFAFRFVPAALGRVGVGSFSVHIRNCVVNPIVDTA